MEIVDHLTRIPKTARKYWPQRVYEGPMKEFRTASHQPNIDSRVAVRKNMDTVHVIQLELETGTLLEMIIGRFCSTALVRISRGHDLPIHGNGFDPFAKKTRASRPCIFPLLIVSTPTSCRPASPRACIIVSSVNPKGWATIWLYSLFSHSSMVWQFMA